LSRFIVTASDGWELTDEVPRATIAGAVPAASRYFSVVVGIEVLHLDRAASVELDDLVIGVERAAAVDVRRAAGLLERDGVLTDVGPPDIVDRAICSLGSVILTILIAESMSRFARKVTGEGMYQVPRQCTPSA
jgi:hypothetical protein